MSWLVKALSISTPPRDTYYSIVDPIEFYEWRFTETIPEGTFVTKQLPKTETITNGKVIVSCRLPKDNLTNQSANAGFKLKKSTQCVPELTAGQIASPLELVNRYKDMSKVFQDGEHKFKEALLSKNYLITNENYPILIKITGQGEEADVQNFGRLDHIKEKLSSVRKILQADASIKKGRAYELEKFRNYESIMTLLDGDRIPVDAQKMDYLLSTAQIKPELQRKTHWGNCYLEFSTEAKNIVDKLNRFKSLQWVQYITGI